MESADLRNISDLAARFVRHVTRNTIKGVTDGLNANIHWNNQLLKALFPYLFSSLRFQTRLLFTIWVCSPILAAAWGPVYNPLYLWARGYVPFSKALFCFLYHGIRPIAQLATMLLWNWIEAFLLLHIPTSWWAPARLILVGCVNGFLQSIAPDVIGSMMRLISPIFWAYRRYFVFDFFRFIMRKNLEISFKTPGSRPSGMKNYEYKPLAQQKTRNVVRNGKRQQEQIKRQIRLIQIDSQLNKAVPTFKLITKNLDDAMISDEPLSSSAINEGKYKFTAVSYVWGSDTQSQGLVIDGKWLPITANAFEILGHNIKLWQDEPSTLFWIDSVCINQADKVEKLEQMQVMGELYSKADRVVAYLKPDDPDEADLAVYLLRSLLTNSLLNDMRHTRAFTLLGQSVFDGILEMLAPITFRIYGKPPSPGWDALAKLMSNRFWTRVWIMQEFVLGTNLRMFYGEHKLDVDELGDFSLRNYEGAPYVSVKVSDLVSGEPIGISRHRVARMIKLRSQRESGERIDYRDLLAASRRMSATEPKDHILAILGLLERSLCLPDNLVSGPDLTCRELFLNVAQFLCGAQGGQFDQADPEWVLSMAGCGYLANKAESLDGFNDHLSPLSWVPNWCRRSSTPFPLMRDRWIRTAQLPVPHITIRGERLHAQLVDVGEIVNVITIGSLFERLDVRNSDRYFQGVMWDTYSFMKALSSDFSGNTYPTGGPNVTALGLTLTAGLGADHTAIFRVLYSNWKKIEALAEGATGPQDVAFKMGFSGFHSFWNSFMSADNQSMMEWVNFTDVCNLRALAMVNCGNEYLALVPDGAQKGDQIGVLQGGEALFALRKTCVPRGFESTEIVYRLLGDCYVHGIEGEKIGRTEGKTVQII